MADIPLPVAPTDFVMRLSGTRQTWQPLTGTIRSNILRGARTEVELSFDPIAGADQRNLAALFARVLIGQDRIMVPFAKLGYQRRGTGGPFTVADMASEATASLELAGDGTIEDADILQIGTAIHLATSKYQRGASLTTMAQIGVWPPLRADVPSAAPIEAVTPMGIYVIGQQTPDIFRVTSRDPHTHLWNGSNSVTLVEA